MSAHEVTFYQAQCDCCGYIETDYGDYNAMCDYAQAVESVCDNGWALVGEEVFCESCWCWPEDLPDYPGDEKWEGTDDQVRKHATHPVEVTE